MSVQPASVIEALKRIIVPENNRDLVRNDMVRDLHVEDKTVRLTVMVSDPGSEFAKGLPEQITRHVKEAVGNDIEVSVSTDTAMIGLGADMMAGQQGPPKHDFGRASVIAVASGKGGVGKSTVTVNLAVSLARQGYSVGLVDTDIYGPSIPTMFGVTDAKPRVNDARKILPIEKAGVKLLSMGFLADPQQAIIWRGPMVSGAIRQFLSDAEWGDLDFLLLDLPPGTGDIQLTIVQTVALTGAIIVSTPQEVALADARRGVAMFENVKVPVLGIIENMAYFTPPELPEKKYYLFGQGGARNLAGSLNVPFLGEIPIEQQLRESGDKGEPLAMASGESVSKSAFESLAKEAALQTAIYKAGLPAQEKVEIIYK